MKLNLYIVPWWLEKALKAHGEPLSTAMDFDKLTRIVSKRDLDFYRELQRELQVLLPVPIVQSFSVGGVLTNGPVSSIPVELSDEEVKRNYLYGFSPETENFPTTPGYTVIWAGYEDVLLTVDPTVSDPKIALNNLMNALLEILNGALPLEEVAALPIFDFWLSLKPQ